MWVSLKGLDVGDGVGVAGFHFEDFFVEDEGEIATAGPLEDHGEIIVGGWVVRFIVDGLREYFGGFVGVALLI